MPEEMLCQYIREMHPSALRKALNLPDMGPRILFHTSWCTACAQHAGPVLDEYVETESAEVNRSELNRIMRGIDGQRA